MTLSKLGPHILAEPSIDETRAVLARWQPTVVKSLGDIHYLPNFADVVPSAKLIQRFWWYHPAGTHDDFPGWYNTFGENTVNVWLDIWGPVLEQRAGFPNMYIESFNESGTSPAYLRFEAQRSRLIFERYGLRSAVINAAVGTTTAQTWIDAREAGLLDAVRQTGSLLALHAYAGFFMTLWHGTRNLGNQANNYLLNDDPLNLMYRPLIPYDDPEGLDSWLAFRCRQDHEALKSLGYGDLRIVLTEFGIDNAGFPTYGNYTGGLEHGGWKTWADTWSRLGFLGGLSPEEFYANQLIWSNYQLLEYPFIEGATIFTYHASEGTLWQRFDIRNTVTPFLVDKLLANMPIPTSPTQPPVEVAAEPALVVVPTLIPPGPGPIQGSPTYHFCLFSTAEAAGWFMGSGAGGRYMDRFRPGLLPAPDLIEWLPPSVSLMLTLIGPAAESVAVQAVIRSRWPGVAFDLITATGPGDVEEILASRVAAGRRFG
jgi:hypothetical protein